ncbi:MAG: hypothetical protein ABSH16_01555 [Sedimentisphaerales bacterium]
MRSKFGLKAVSIGMVLVMGVVARGAGEPNSVGEIFKFNKMEWLIGEWEATTDVNETPDKNIRGQVAEAKFEWTLDGYALSIKARVGRYGYEGMAYYVASKNTIVNTGVDNRGRSFGGSWLIDGDKLLLKIEQTARDGSINNFERSLSKVDANTMKSVTYSVSDGKRSDEPIGVLEFKRKKEANPKL